MMAMMMTATMIMILKMIVIMITMIVIMIVMNMIEMLVMMSMAMAVITSNHQSICAHSTNEFSIQRCYWCWFRFLSETPEASWGCQKEHKTARGKIILFHRWHRWFFKAQFPVLSQTHTLLLHHKTRPTSYTHGMQGVSMLFRNSQKVANVWAYYFLLLEEILPFVSH